MIDKRKVTRDSLPLRWYRGANVPMRVIRKFTRDVVEHFHPEKVILFGSHAYGTPHADSDVDILVIMPCPNQLDQAFKIHWTLQPPFPLDIIVRTPHNLRWRLEEGESFHTEIVSKGKVLYDNASKRQATSALRWAGRVRDACRRLLGLGPPRRRRM